MSIGKALLEDVCQNPQDYVPRLVYADWLDENGEADRAELIRIGIRGGDNKRLPALYQQWEQSWKKKELPTLPGIEWGYPSRGFVELVVADSVDTFEAALPRLREVIPLRHVLLLGRNVSPEWFTRSCFAGLDGLTIRCDRFTDGNVGLFANAPLETLTNLDLNLAESPLSEAGVCLLLRSLRCSHLHWLRIVSPPNRFGATAAQVIADGPLPGLDNLCLQQWDLSTAGAALAVGQNLTRLRLIGDRFGDEAVAALCAAGLPPRLDALMLSRNNVGPIGAAALAGCELPQSMSWLCLPDNPLNSEGLSVLARRARFRPKALLMANVRAGDAGVEALANSALLDEAEVLVLRDNDVGPAGAAALADSPRVGRLHTLNLARNRIGDEGARRLAQSPWLGGLTQLNVEDNSLSEQALQLLRDRFGEALQPRA